MTNRIFEYALVYEEAETPDLHPLPAYSLCRHLTENAEFLQLMGFSVTLNLPDNITAAHAHQDLDSLNNTDITDSTSFLGDETLLKRIFNNLFSNVIKYGEKKEPVAIHYFIKYSTSGIRPHPKYADRIKKRPQNAGTIEWKIGC